MIQIFKLSLLSVMMMALPLIETLDGHDEAETSAVFVIL